MTEHRWTFEKESKQPDVVFWLDDGVGSGVDWLLSYIRSEVERGHQFRAGETVQIGWMVVMLQGGEHGDVEIWEPGFDSMPIRWTRSLNNTFRHLVMQRSVCDQFHISPSFPSLRQAARLAPGFLSRKKGFLMSRRESSGNDSGWLFCDITRKDDESEPRSLYEISLHCPEMIPFLALPPGASVKHTSLQIEAVLGDLTVASSSNDLLSRLSRTTIFV